MPATAIALLLLIAAIALGVVAGVRRSKRLGLLAAGLLIVFVAYVGALLFLLSGMG